MQSIRTLYKIGRGPSSSHTMGPERACKFFKSLYPQATYEAILYGSLALTGKGHLTDRIIKETLTDVEVVFSSEFVGKHPNTFDLVAYDDDKELSRMRFYSIGGGDIEIEGHASEKTLDVYPHRTFREIEDFCSSREISLPGYVRLFEGSAIDSVMRTVKNAMIKSVVNGLKKGGKLPGELEVQRKASTLFDRAGKAEDNEDLLLSAYAFAVSEENASGNQVVTAPTCGASGVLPAVLYHMESTGFDEANIIDGLLVAGLIGNIIRRNASISGAEAGCQAEVGSACSMAAAFHATLWGRNLEQIEYASEVALEHHLGLTCDPILGYVQIPCIERNAVAALRAVNASRLAYYLSDYRKIPFDMVVETMLETGKDLSANYRETASGGLAKRFFKQ